MEFGMLETKKWSGYARLINPGGFNVDTYTTTHVQR